MTNLSNYAILISFWNLFFFSIFSFELLFKLCANDAIVAFYNFFWANGATVITFFLLIFLITLLFCDERVRVQKGLTLFFVFYSAELESFFLTNQLFWYFNLATSDINFFLINALNKYHPFFLYESVFTLFIALLLEKQTNLPYKQINFFFYLMLFLNVSALFFGAWWAAQEGSWGGWWNWDPSETLGLIIFIACSLFLHVETAQKKNRLKMRILLTSASLFFTLAYFFVQINFAATSHNFGIKFFFFFSVNFFATEALSAVLLLILSLFVLSQFYFFKYKFFKKTPNKLNFKKILIYFFIFQFCIIANYLSFLTLINFFCHNALHFIVFTAEAGPLLYFFVFLTFYAFQSFSVCFYVLVLFFNSSLVLLSFFKFKHFAHALHFFLYLSINDFFLIEKLNYAISFIISVLNQGHSILILDSTQNSFYHLNTNYIELFKTTQINHWNGNYCLNSINLFSMGNLANHQTIFSVSYFLTHLVTNVNYSFINLFTELKCSNVLFSLLTLPIIFFIVNFF